jgi:hypothetical protein
MIYNQSEFASFCHCTRQNVCKYVKLGYIKKNSDGKIDTDDPVNKNWIESRFINDSIAAAKKDEPPPQKKEIEKRPETNKSKQQENITLPRINTREPVKKSIPNDFYKPVQPFTLDGTDLSKMSMAQRKVYLETAKLQEQYEKLRIENQKARCEVVYKETLGNTCFGYLSALNKMILALPVSYVDEFGAAYKKGKGKTELTDILRKPITQAIIDAREQMKKEIARYVAEMKYTEKEKETDKSDNTDE